MKYEVRFYYGHRMLDFVGVAKDRKNAFKCAKENLNNLSGKFKDESALEAILVNEGREEFAVCINDDTGRFSVKENIISIGEMYNSI